MSLYLKMVDRWDFSRMAFSNVGGTQTYAELHQSVLNTVAWLRTQGVESGDVLCVQLPKSKTLLNLLLAGLAMGSPVLPLNDRYTAPEVSYYVRDVGAKLAILMVEPEDWDGQVLLMKDMPVEFPLQESVDLQPVSDESLALLLYTSGTTGRPKGAMISHGNLLASIQALHDAWQWTSEDRLLHLLPLFHVHGLVVAQFGALYANACSFWMPAKWEPEEVVDVWKQQNISICMMVPTIVHRLLSVEKIPALPNFRLATSGSAPLPISAHQRFQAKFGCYIVERYGMTEVGIVLSNPYPHGQKAGTVGFPLGEMCFKIVNTAGEECVVDEVGELLISGPSVISGYWQQPDATERTIVNGWLHSGDLASLDADGYYSIVGRSKDLIISGGFNVYPKEVEKVLLDIEGVEQAAVVGLPSDEWGEVVVAVVIGHIDWQRVEAVSKSKLAPYKRPRHMLIVDEFPCNAMGKVQKAKLREFVKEKLQGE
jgi:malonyl-CoA/methylmalonyl-CoA synthetase